MTRDIEIEISDQSNVASTNILKEKKHDVDKLIANLSLIFSNYTLIFISFRELMPHDELRFKFQTSFFLFQLFLSSFLLQIMTTHINIKIDLKRAEVFRKQRSWTSITFAEIEAFVKILLYIAFVLYLVSSIIEIMILMSLLISWSLTAWVINDESKSNDIWRFSIS